MVGAMSALHARLPANKAKHFAASADVSVPVVQRMGQKEWKREQEKYLWGMQKEGKCDHVRLNGTLYVTLVLANHWILRKRDHGIGWTRKGVNVSDEAVD